VSPRGSFLLSPDNGNPPHGIVRIFYRIGAGSFAPCEEPVRRVMLRGLAGITMGRISGWPRIERSACNASSPAATPFTASRIYVLGLD
jgi:hypothetical protein